MHNLATDTSGYQQANSGTYFRVEVPNTTPGGTTSPDRYEPVGVTENGQPFTTDDIVQYIPPATETLTWDWDGNLLGDGRRTYTRDGADRLIRMESAAFTQPASGSVPAVSVPAKLLEFSYDGLSRRIRKKVQEKPAGSSTWSIVKWEAYVYDGWSRRLPGATGDRRRAAEPAGRQLREAELPSTTLVMAVNLNPTAGGYFGKAQSLVASYVWGPDIGSPTTARSDWQRAGGVGGLLMAVYPVAATGSVPTFAQWMTSEGYNPLPQEGSNEWEDALWNYQSIWGSNVNVHVPVMDHMGNVLGVTRLAATPGSGGTATSEYVYDYDAFGKEMRSSSLVANGNPDSFPFHYSTKFTDGETGLNYYGYRYLDTQRGRWINRDPIGEDGGVNLYGMAGNDSISRSDYVGLADPADPSLMLDFTHDDSISDIKEYSALAKSQRDALQRALNYCHKMCATRRISVKSRFTGRKPKRSAPKDNNYNLEDAGDRKLAEENRSMSDRGDDESNVIPVTLTNSDISLGKIGALGVSSKGSGVLLSAPAILQPGKRIPQPVNTLAHEIGHYAGYEGDLADGKHARIDPKKDRDLMERTPAPFSIPDKQWCEKVANLAK